ncbi:hypothetical protein [Streptomyces sp. NPDC096012]|uniref:hypothetical protein n=1 Tax=Streptomyces sp. NPDC096012 TaxID=3155684 RepID=UPI00336A13DB
MNDPGTGTVPTPLEERLRAALAARAYSVGPADLRPLRPPTGELRPARVRLRRAVAGALVLAAVAALVFFTVRGGHTGPAEPARAPRPAVPTPSPAPRQAGPLTPEPSPTAVGP